MAPHLFLPRCLQSNKDNFVFHFAHLSFQYDDSDLRFHISFKSVFYLIPFTLYSLSVWYTDYITERKVLMLQKGLQWFFSESNVGISPRTEWAILDCRYQNDCLNLSNSKWIQTFQRNMRSLTSGLTWRCWEGWRNEPVRDEKWERKRPSQQGASRRRS